MSAYPWPVPKERPTAAEAVNPEDINDAQRAVVDAGGTIGEHMLCGSLKVDLNRKTNYPALLYMGTFWGETDLLADMKDFDSTTSPVPAGAVKLYPGRGWQLVEVWSFTLPYMADVVADASLQLTADRLSSEASLGNIGAQPVMSQGAAGLALDGVLCPDFPDYGPDRSAEDFQMTQAQCAPLTAPYPHGIWRDVPAGLHTIAIKAKVDPGHFTPNLSQPLWAWSRSVMVKALYK